MTGETTNEEKYYKFGIIGFPIGHSLSSVMHEAALKSLDLKGEYQTLETKPEDLIDRIKMLKRDNFNGFNVTIPHKVPVSLFLSKVDEYANLAGSVNTIKILEDKSLEGFNTDVYGYIKAIPDDVDLKGKKAAILGTGGAARAVIVGLKSLGVAEITLFTRNIIDSHQTAETFRNKFPDLKILPPAVRKLQCSGAILKRCWKCHGKRCPGTIQISRGRKRCWKQTTMGWKR